MICSCLSLASSDVSYVYCLNISLIISTTGDPCYHAASDTILISVSLNYVFRDLGIYGSNFRKLFNSLQKSKAFKSINANMSWTYKCLTILMKNTVSTAHTKTLFRKISFKSKLEKSGVYYMFFPFY